MIPQTGIKMCEKMQDMKASKKLHDESNRKLYTKDLLSLVFPSSCDDVSNLLCHLENIQTFCVYF